MIVSVLAGVFNRCDLSETDEVESLRVYCSKTLGSIIFDDKYVLISDMIIELKERMLKSKFHNELDSILTYLSLRNFELFLNIEHPDASEISVKGSSLMTIYSKSINWRIDVYENADGDLEENRTGESTLFQPMMDYFIANKSSKKSDFYHNMFCYTDFDNVSGEEYFVEFDEDENEEMKVKIFGSKNNYNQFYKNAFI